MKIEIPNTWLGEEINGSIDKVLNREKHEPEKSFQTASDLDGFEYVPSLGLYVAKKKELHGENWNSCKTALHQRGDRMPTIYEFVEFMKHLRTKNDNEATTILDEVYTVRDPWRAEWLDARFEEGTMKCYAFEGQNIKEESKDLTGILSKDKTPGIDLKIWLSDNHYGLPKESSASDKGIWYWYPRAGYVARFNAYSDGANLDCDGDPAGRDDALGVRAVRRPSQNFSGGNRK
jgi:hypothetical protein